MGLYPHDSNFSLSYCPIPPLYFADFPCYPTLPARFGFPRTPHFPRFSVLHSFSQPLLPVPLCPYRILRSPFTFLRPFTLPLHFFTPWFLGPSSRPLPPVLAPVLAPVFAPVFAPVLAPIFAPVFAPVLAPIQPLPLLVLLLSAGPPFCALHLLCMLRVGHFAVVSRVVRLATPHFRPLLSYPSLLAALLYVSVIQCVNVFRAT